MFNKTKTNVKSSGIWKAVSVIPPREKDKDKVIHVSVSLFTRIMTMESGTIKTQGLKNMIGDSNININELNETAKTSLRTSFEKDFKFAKDKIEKTWQIVLNSQNKVAYALVR